MCIFVLFVLALHDVINISDITSTLSSYKYGRNITFFTNV